jgi:hypothetical protein
VWVWVDLLRSRLKVQSTTKGWSESYHHLTGGLVVKKMLAASPLAKAGHLGKLPTYSRASTYQRSGGGPPPFAHHSPLTTTRGREGVLRHPPQIEGTLRVL